MLLEEFWVYMIAEDLGRAKNIFKKMPFIITALAIAQYP